MQPNRCAASWLRTDGHRNKAGVPAHIAALGTRICISMEGMTRLAMRPPLVAMLALSMLGSACTVPPMQRADELRVDSVTLRPQNAAGVSNPPFCLHLRFKGQFYVAYSERQVESWVTEGSCDSEGAPRTVDQLRMNWRFQGYDTQRSRQCMNANGCRSQERDIIEGHALRCASAMAQHGNQTAFLTTDVVGCP